jgi:DNA-binding MarR family transcriptional regulator
MLLLVNAAVSFGDKEVGAVGARLGINRNASTRGADALSRRGWIRRVPDKSHRSKVLLEPTAEGRAFARRFLAELARS